MSASIGYQRTEKCNWIPRAFAIVAAFVSINLASTPGHAAIPGSEAELKLASTQWESWILAILDAMMLRLTCQGTELPDDVPVAMMVMVDCYEAGGLLPMTLLDRLVFLAQLDEAELAVKLAPSEFPEEARRKFLGAVATMREEVQVVP